MTTAELHPLPVRRKEFNAFMDHIVTLVKQRRERIDNTPTNVEGKCSPYRPVMVALAAGAGAGKTTFAEYLVSHLLHTKAPCSLKVHGPVSATYPAELPIYAKSVSLDGYHLYRKELDAFPAGSLYREWGRVRRGAPFTFNPKKYYNDLVTLYERGKAKLPSFDHAARDPTEGDIIVDGHPSPSTGPYGHEIIIVEGLYTLLDGSEQSVVWPYPDSQDPVQDADRKNAIAQIPPISEEDKHYWRLASSKGSKDGKERAFYDVRVFIQLPIAVAVERLVKRHMKAWGISHQDALHRASGSDYDNSLVAIRSGRHADFVLHSVKNFKQPSNDKGQSKL